MTDEEDEVPADGTGDPGAGGDGGMVGETGKRRHQPEVRRALKLIDSLRQMAGLNRRDLDQRMGLGRGNSSLILKERVDLKYHHILAILDVLEVDPGTFFRLLYPDPSEIRSQPQLLGRFLDRIQEPKPRPKPAPPSTDTQLDELERRILERIERAVSALEKKQEG